MSDEAPPIELNIINGQNGFIANVEAGNPASVNTDQDNEQPSALPNLVPRPSYRPDAVSRPPSTLSYWCSGLYNITKALGRCLQPLRLFLSKASSLTVIVLTLFGILFYSLRTYDLAQWTATKDFWEYCQSSQVSKDFS